MSRRPLLVKPRPAAPRECAIHHSPQRVVISADQRLAFRIHRVIKSTKVPHQAALGQPRGRGGSVPMDQ